MGEGGRHGAAAGDRDRRFAGEGDLAAEGGVHERLRPRARRRGQRLDRGAELAPQGLEPLGPRRKATAPDRQVELIPSSVRYAK